MRGWEMEDEHSAIGAEKGGCQGGEKGGMMWSKPLASTTIFCSSPLDTNQEIKEHFARRGHCWAVGIHEKMMMSPQIMKRQAGRRQFYLQTNFLTIISSLTPPLVSRAPVGPCLLNVSLEWALLPAPSLDVPYAQWRERNFQNREGFRSCPGKKNIPAMLCLQGCVHTFSTL